MKLRFSYGQFLSELLQAMAMADPYCYSVLVDPEVNATDWTRLTVPQNLPANTVSALPRRAWSSNSQP